jgi:DNA-binding LacI/PurR family transcriptional regulator
VEQTGSSAGKRPTLEDVAARTGMSRSLVSLVMRGARTGATAETRERVLKAAAEIGYRPDARARLLASGQSRLIGVVFGMAGRFHLELLDGLYVAAKKADYQVILSALTPRRDEGEAVETMLDFRCEAAIMLASPDSAIRVLAGRLPVVAVGWHVSDPAVDVVRTSDDEGMRQAIDHLVDLGHRQILHVDGGAGPVSTSRRRGYRAAMHRHGLKQEARVIRGGISQEDGSHAAGRILAENALPTAIVAYNDDVAAGLVESLGGAGISVPDNMSVVGWDDSSLARLPHVNLTTVRQDADVMTRLAVQRSVSRIQDDPVTEREQVLRPRLIIRGSTSSPDQRKPVPR